jgi:hypothetical protein
VETALVVYDGDARHPMGAALLDLYLCGNTLDYAAQACAMSYSEAQMVLRAELERLDADKGLLPSVAAAQLDLAMRSIANAVKAGDTSAIREWRNLIESKRKLYGVDAVAKGEDAPPVVISFSFESPARVPMAEVVGRSEAHDLRPAPDFVDRDGNEDGQDGGGSDLDLRGDRPR